MTIRLTDVVKYYKGLPHQDKALKALEELLGDVGLSEFQEWVQLWRTPATEEPAAETEEEDAEGASEE